MFFKEDNICLSSGAKEAALNEKRVKPCVPISKPATLRRGTGPPLLLVKGLSAEIPATEDRICPSITITTPYWSSPFCLMVGNNPPNNPEDRN